MHAQSIVKNRFPWPLLENRSIGEYRRFILRNSGQQVYASLFLDAYNQRLLRGTDFTYTESSPALLYLNGEYWGIHNIREFQDEHFLESLHFADRDQIDFLEKLPGGSFGYVPGITSSYCNSWPTTILPLKRHGSR